MFCGIVDVGIDGLDGLDGTGVQESFDEFAVTGFYSFSLFEKIVKYHILDLPRDRGRRDASVKMPNVETFHR